MITEERVKQAYQVAQIRPTKGEFTELYYEINGDDKQAVQCGCAVTALLMAECGWSFDQVSGYEQEQTQDDMFEEIALQLKEEPAYIRQFILGFDGLSIYRGRFGDNVVPWDHGFACRTAIFNPAPAE